MKQAQERPPTTSLQPSRSTAGGAPGPASVALWQLNMLRVGYLVMGGGLAVFKWPLLLDAEHWGLKEGTVDSLLFGMSVLALLGLRYPLRLLPILLFEVIWKLTWLGLVALPLWLDGRLEGATRDQAATILLVVIVIAVIPWRHVLAQYVMAPGQPWRRSRRGRADTP